jgi:toxin ParE1/3/4
VIDRLSSRAEADPAEIWVYSAEQWTLDQADRYVDALVSRFDWLCDNPLLWKARPDIADGLYSYPQQSHAIYFRAHGDMLRLIEIVRVLHGRMEPHRRV